ncbi:integral membrane sensor signal transduction histidine kinase [Paenibacillus curdlanolyticus YK9]|uniref:Integral membrane sensor signal transduction histidine kinase n=1 Tax=Paenibacillus curdlanolyticus YK9 TaxID=717606 RepID=E0IFB8_9BACL|nr:sensor histidine kinase [Paenibacillus curdlanolyticus]EFM08894.1 integral membrane sensor signal transduction histidine kinase [Paenibacillus curdlanolyticus YK9]
MIAKLRMRLNMNNIRFRNKMLIMYMLSVFIPVVMTNVIFYSITADNIRHQKKHDISLAVKQIRDDFQDQINAAAGISTVLYNDTLLWQYVRQPYDSLADYVEMYNSYISLMLEKYSPLYKTIQSITIYTTNDTIIYGGRVQPITDHIKQQGWYGRVIEASPSAVAIEKIESDLPGKPDTLSLFRRISGGEEGDNQPILLRLDFHPDLMEDVFRNVSLNGTLYLLQNDHLLYSTDSAATEAAISKPARGTLVFKESFPASYLMNWEVVGVFKEETVLADVRRSRQFVLYFAMLNLLVPTLIIILFNRSLNTRLIRILKQMKRVKNQTFEPIVEPETRDEIGQLTQAFNQMTLQIRRLINDVYVADIQKKELELKRNQAQLNALQSQINPHFLFNALETIRMRSLIKQENETAHIISNMAKIFRKSLTWGRDWVTVKEEIDLVVCFLEIQKYRFEDKLHYSIDVDPSVEQALIPKMTLQPLVENASIHGIEAVKRSGLINVSIQRTGDGLVCKVTDNGGGIEPDKLQALNDNLTQSEEMGEHVGIANVYYRLKLFYGDAVDFRLSSEPGVGTCVSIIVRESDGQAAVT